MAIAYHPGTVKTGLSKEFWGGVKEGKLFTPEFASGRCGMLCRMWGLRDGGSVGIGRERRLDLEQEGGSQVLRSQLLSLSK